jgi:MFS family permease
MKKLLFSRHEFQHITLDFALMLMMSFLMRAGQFMLLPFLAIYLTRFPNASPTTIGIVIGIGPFIYGIANLFAGKYVDKFGAKTIMCIAAFLGGIILLFFFYQHSIVWCMLMNTLVGITRAFFDISSKSYGLDKLSYEQRKISFSLRFMAVNCAAAIGPIAGAYFAAKNALISFKIIGLLYIFLSILSCLILKHVKTVSKNKNLTTDSLIKIFLTNQSLQILVIINAIIFLIFSQIDSTLPQYLYTNLNNGTHVYSILLIINATICITMQLIVAKFTQLIDEYKIACLGTLFFSLSYLLFALTLNFPALITAIIIMTFAEIILMPLNDSIVARISPPEKIGTYYGIAGVAMFGLGIGPIFGGLIYQYQNAKTLYLACSAILLILLFLYKKLMGFTNEKN